MATCLVFLFLAFFAFSANSDVSIDCGASESYTDERFLVWTGDDGLFQNSQSEVVQSSNTISHVMSTLRVFTTRKKNCYSIPEDKGSLLLVRASFFYGNYDRKSSPPSFDMHFDGNEWTTVKTSLDKLVYYEVVYVSESDTTSICLSQTQPNQFPFISALEVTKLDSKMYSYLDPKHALFLSSRVAYGAPATVRYPDDAYDRIWDPETGGSGITSVASDAIIGTANAPDNPPQAVLQNAITISSTSNSISIIRGFPDQKLPIYMNLYFSEVTQLDTTQKRSFRAYIDSTPVSGPIIPPYGDVTEMSINFTASSNTSFLLFADPDSTLPPLVNALEAFYISDRLTDGTDSKDVEGLSELQKAFSDVFQEFWSGDPCLPSPYTWEWTSCSNDTIPRITALNLGSFNLSGELPDFSSMDALVTINLQNNSITGPIPDFLGALPNLKELNLADNSFSGPIPPSITSNKKLKLVVSGNPDLCVSSKSCQTTSTDGTTSSSSSPSGSRKKSNKLPVILGTTIPIFVIFWALVGFLLHHKRKTAAIAAITTGQTGGANRPGGANNMTGKIGGAVINEIKVNFQDQTTTENGSQSDPQQ